MAMTRKLWSISALATEFNIDRRTAAGRIADIPPAGKVRGHDAWRLADVVDALLPRPAGPPPGAPRDPLLQTLVERAADWREIHAHADETQLAATERDFSNLSIDELAELVGADPADVLRWLRAGMPYHVRGDFESGDGFTIRASHAIDWLGLVHRAALAADAVRYVAGALRLPGRR